MSKILNLAPNEIHLWIAFLDEIKSQELLISYEQLMNTEERAKWLRFRFAKHRHQYLVTRALIRTTLSHYINKSPKKWQFSKNKYGRPEILQANNRLRFNLSHTDNLVICGLVWEKDIGVDVENQARQNATIEIADRFFSQQEVTDLHQLPKQLQQSRFFDYWTLKEAYIKARGMGLSLPLKYFSFHFLEQRTVKISFHANIKDEPNQWQFWLLQLTKQYKAAIALRQDIEQPYQIIIKKVVPLFGETDFNYITPLTP